jgi:hypothetical protein
LALLFSLHSTEIFPKPEVVLISGEVKKPPALIKMGFKSFSVVMAEV